MKRIAIPITKNNTIENHFGRSKFYEIYTFSSTNEIVDIQLIESEHGGGCKSNIINVLADEGVGSIISGNIGDKAMSKLAAAGIGVIRGYSGKSADVILEFVENKISDKGGSCQHHSKKHKKGLGCNHES
ncbi:MULTISPECIES: NifB/NifX family molybdenum-iron cluster-binding protein [unclassified Algibacter]|uniref:NifB/NifX family molybdenum-iron cluster-binding protein n=1 Tax=unclassified Algibacter TaxID=2615009 RepID=UPI00131B1459|nr:MULTISPECIES: NifB/NifX family molybdenum-iron cluster-binding protein [unclassified Algibacter]MCL5130320.1 hypothetical protein [Algibacter sp. L4_22]